MLLGGQLRPGTGVSSSAAEHSHCNIYHCSECACSNRRKGNYVACQNRTLGEHGPLRGTRTTQIPPGVKVTELQKGGPNEPFFTSVYADEFTMDRVQVDSFD